MGMLRAGTQAGGGSEMLTQILTALHGMQGTPVASPESGKGCEPWGVPRHGRKRAEWCADGYSPSLDERHGPGAGVDIG